MNAQQPSRPLVEPLAYSMPAAAHARGIRQHHVRYIVERGELPIVKLGSRTLISRATLEQLLTACEQRVTKEG